MANDSYKRAFDDLLETYIYLGGSGEMIVRNLNKTPNVETRSKLIAELRSLESKRLEILDQMDNLSKST
ncbi:MAG: hypothetical protein WCA19_24015 [Candidatus Acidiferrales bacterium]